MLADKWFVLLLLLNSFHLDFALNIKLFCFLFPFSIEWGLHKRERPPKREVRASAGQQAPTVTREHPRGAVEAAGMTGKSLIKALALTDAKGGKGYWPKGSAIENNSQGKKLESKIYKMYRGQILWRNSPFF